MLQSEAYNEFRVWVAGTRERVKALLCVVDAKFGTIGRVNRVERIVSSTAEVRTRIDNIRRRGNAKSKEGKRGAGQGRWGLCRAGQFTGRAHQRQLDWTRFTSIQ